MQFMKETEVQTVRSMIVSLCFFIASFVVVATNAAFVTSHLEKNIALLDSLPATLEGNDREKIAKTVSDIESSWNDRLTLLSLSINLAELRDCTIAIKTLSAYTDADDPADYTSSLSQVRLLLKTLLYRERFAFINII